MKNNKGITLVALVVTIIVLLILAAVGINLVLGENGIITRAKEAKTKSELVAEYEKSDLEKLLEQIDLNNLEQFQITGEEAEKIIIKYLENEREIDKNTQNVKHKLLAEGIKEKNGELYEVIINTETYYNGEVDPNQMISGYYVKKVNEISKECEIFQKIMYEGQTENIFFVDENYEEFEDENNYNFSSFDLYKENEEYYKLISEEEVRETSNKKYEKNIFLVSGEGFNDKDFEKAYGINRFKENKNNELEWIKAEFRYATIMYDYKTKRIIDIEEPNTEDYQNRYSKSGRELLKYLESKDRISPKFVEGNYYTISKDENILFRLRLENETDGSKEFSLIYGVDDFYDEKDRIGIDGYTEDSNGKIIAIRYVYKYQDYEGSDIFTIYIYVNSKTGEIIEKGGGRPLEYEPIEKIKSFYDYLEERKFENVDYNEFVKHEYASDNIKYMYLKNGEEKFAIYNRYNEDGNKKYEIDRGDE